MTSPMDRSSVDFVAPDYEQIRASLLSIDDTEVNAAVRVLDTVFRAARYRPLAATLATVPALVEAVTQYFPTPFARKFGGWRDAHQDFTQALDSAADGQDGPQTVPPAIARRFRESFLEMWACWRQIVHFVPFMLMAALRRIDDDLLQQHAARELKQALHHYKAFYEAYDDDRRRESDQRHLLVCLLKVFRKLSRTPALGPDFVFASLMQQQGGGFDALFPERFDAAMLLIQQIRNRIAHGGLENRSAPVLAAIDLLTRWCFLDLVACLVPLCRELSLNYVTSLTIEGDRVTLDALDFSGLAGPNRVQFRANSAPQLDEFRIADLRLYLIRRRCMLEQRDGAAMVIADYLDLTPFLIAQALRGTARENTALPLGTDRLVFALEQYRQPRRELVFLELAGSDQRTLSSGRNDLMADLLLQKIDGFVTRARLLTAHVVAPADQRGNIGKLRTQLWLISREHLASALDVRGWDERGQPADDEPTQALRAVYNPRLFVEPIESARVRAFIDGDRQALLVVGPSGFGKSNLLVHHFLQVLRTDRLAVFLAGRQFDSADFLDILQRTLVRQIAADWNTLAELDRLLDILGETLYVFIDAVNEYSGHLGPVALLHDLLAALVRESLLRRCKFIVTCRSETWQRYREQYGGERPLDTSCFDSTNGQPVMIGSFDEPQRRRQLYQAYQREYQLQPVSYDSLSDAARVLIAQPFMMALAAETYSNRPESASAAPLGIATDAANEGAMSADPGAAMQREVPAELDYFRLFDRLTERKKIDGQVLFPASDRLRRARFGDELELFCVALAQMLFDRLSSSDGTTLRAANLTAVPIDEVDKSPAMQTWVRGDGQISVLEAALQLGIIELVNVPRRNARGQVVSGEAFAFFHDQYTQYWLAAAFQAQLLGWLDNDCLGDARSLSARVEGMASIVARSVQAPVLLGALDHWLNMNLQLFHGGRVAPMLPLFNALAAHESSALRYYLASTLAHLLQRAVITPQALFTPLLRDGSAALRRESVNIFVENWHKLAPAALRAYIDATDPNRDADSLDQLADVFAGHVMSEPKAVQDYLLASLNTLSLASVIEPQRALRQFRFALQFTMFAVLGGFDRPATLDAASTVFRGRYQVAIDLLSGQGKGIAPAQLTRRGLRKLMFWLFESVGAAKFDQFMAAMPGSGNERFFQNNDGVVQRDVLLEFLPYAVALHNGEFASLSLAESSPFRALMLRMLDFRITSIIGYNAVLCLPSVLLRSDWAETQDFVLELIQRRTPSALFHGTLLLLNLAYSDARQAPPCLELIQTKIVPMLLAQGLECDWSIGFCIAALDVAQLWPGCHQLLRQLFDHYEASADPQACSRFGDTLYKIAYCQDIALGQRTLAMMLTERDRFLRPPWRDSTLKLCAALFVRSPSALRTVLLAHSVDDELIRAAMAFRSDELVRQSRLFPLQVDANRFTAWIYVGEPRLRYAVVKYFIGSLASGDSVRDFAAGFRQTLIAIIEVYFGRDRERLPSGRLHVDEIFAATRSARRVSARSAAP